MNKKLFKGALVLFASILMAVSCNNNSTGGGNDGNGNGNGNTETPAKVTVSAEDIQGILTAIGTSGVVELKESGGSKNAKIDLSALVLEKDSSKENTFKAASAKKAEIKEGSSTAVSGTDKIKKSEINTKVSKAIKDKITDLGTSGNKGISVEDNNTVVTIDADGASKKATAVVTFKQNNATATITFPIEFTSTLNQMTFEDK